MSAPRPGPFRLRRPRAAVAALFALAAALGATAPPASGQGTELAPPERKVRSVLLRPGEELDRVELGAAAARGYFDVIGSVAYRRLIRVAKGWEHSVVGEVAGARKDPITEGVVSAQYLFRPERSYRVESRLRPLLEVGPGLHLSVQGASIEGFPKTTVHARVYLKAHAYAGVEALLSRKLGIALRGRLSLPSHQPLEYAQAAILLR